MLSPAALRRQDQQLFWKPSREAMIFRDSSMEALTPTYPSTIPQAINRKKVRALLLGDRIETAGLERSDVLSTAPLAFRAGQDGVAAVFRYGVVVLFGLSVLEEDEVLRGLTSRIIGPFSTFDDEHAVIEA